MTLNNFHRRTLHSCYLIMYSSTSANSELILSKLIVTGINYRHADATERSFFSVSSDNCHLILESARKKKIKSLFILSTCNRTELYAYSQHQDDLIDLLLQHTRGSADTFRKAGFIKRGAKALDHLFRVAAGLDSQITGDCEIQGQLKSALAFSRGHKMIGPVMDRTVNFALQASKSVRTNTKLSAGTVSVSYAAIEWLGKINNVRNKKIVLLGAGKFGKKLAKNLKHYFPTNAVTIINRTDDTAKLLAASLSFAWKSFSTLEEQIKIADIILVCTKAPSYTLLPRFFSGEKEQWILDLSVPENSDPVIKNISRMTVTGIDEVSNVMKATLTKRNSEIPQALKIIEHYQQEFYEWLQLQQHVPLINAMKDKLCQLGEIHFREDLGMEMLMTRVNKAIGSLAMDLRYKREKGCHFINAINEFLQPDTAHE